MKYAVTFYDEGGYSTRIEGEDLAELASLLQAANYNGPTLGAEDPTGHVVGSVNAGAWTWTWPEPGSHG